MKTNEKIHLKHGFDAVYDSTSEILILGSFPSVKSREEQFYYANKQNRFWKVIADIYNADIPTSIQEKKQLILSNSLALWDIIAECDIHASSDNTIENVTPNDLRTVLEHAPIRKIIANGATAGKFLNKYFKLANNYEILILPSTSPANASYSIDRLTGVWRDALL